jgi:chromate transporter
MAEHEPHAAPTARTAEAVASRVPIRDLVRYDLRLGALGLGGPVALCGQLEKELVGERQWLTRDERREAIAVCQSLPGHLAMQVGIFLSYRRGGFWGAWTGGWAFILPKFVVVSALGLLYGHLGGLPWGVSGLLEGRESRDLQTELCHPWAANDGH